MKVVNSISGGKTSAFMAAHFPADYDVFALVRTSDESCRFPDDGVRRLVEDKIGMDFLGTLEDDVIVYTMLDLEQYLGREITWVSGITYDDLIRRKGDYLPNKVQRYCTTHMKLEPIFYWWHRTIGEPIAMNLGYRANERIRMMNMLSKLNHEGLLEFKATFGLNERGQNKWEDVAWQFPQFPLITELPTFKDGIEEYWKDKGVRFAAMNNCVGCFHRNPVLLRKMFDLHPNKMEWFASQEQAKRSSKGIDTRSHCQWRSDMTYREIESRHLQLEFSFEEWDEECESGYCGL